MQSGYAFLKPPLLLLLLLLLRIHKFGCLKSARSLPAHRTLPSCCRNSALCSFGCAGCGGGIEVDGLKLNFPLADQSVSRDRLIAKDVVFPPPRRSLSPFSWDYACAIRAAIVPRFMYEMTLTARFSLQSKGDSVYDVCNRRGLPKRRHAGKDGMRAIQFALPHLVISKMCIKALTWKLNLGCVCLDGSKNS